MSTAQKKLVRKCTKCGQEVPMDCICLLPQTELYYREFAKHLLDENYPMPTNGDEEADAVALCPTCMARYEQEQYFKKVNKEQ